MSNRVKLFSAVATIAIAGYLAVAVAPQQAQAKAKNCEEGLGLYPDQVRHFLAAYPQCRR